MEGQEGGGSSALMLRRATMHLLAAIIACAYILIGTVALPTTHSLHSKLGLSEDDQVATSDQGTPRDV